MSFITIANLIWLTLRSSGYQDQTQPTGASNLGGDAALGAGVLGAGAAASHHHGQDQDNIGQESGRSFPLGGNSNTTAGSGYPSDSAGLASDTTTGPHSSDLANKVDPRVDSDLDGSRGLGNSGYDTSAGTGTTAVGQGYGAEKWKHEHGAHGHQYEGDPCGPEESAPGAPRFTTGPHVTDTANRLDPHVASDMGVPAESTNTASELNLGSKVPGEDHHHGRDAAIAGSVGAAGAGAYESSRDTPSGPTEQTSTGTGAHKSSLLNKLDPRVHSDTSQQYDPVSTDEPLRDTGKDHYGRDAGLAGAGAGAGAGGIGGYEAEKHIADKGYSGPTSSTEAFDPYRTSGLDRRVDSEPVTGSGTLGSTDNSGADKDHHYGRDAGLAGAGLGAAGVGAYEAEKHRHPGQSATTDASSYPTSGSEPRDTTTDPYSGREATAAGAAGTVLGTAGTSEFSKKDAEKLAKEHQKDLEKEQKAIHKDQVKHEKAIAKEEKAIEKEEKKHEKEIEKEEKKHDGKKHGGILGLFHRDKSDKALKDEEIERQGDKSHHGAEAAAEAGAAGVVGAEFEHEKEKHERNRLHKDPPAGYSKTPESGYASQVTGGTGTTALAEGDGVPSGPVGYSKAPESGYASQVTGGTGTTALAEGDDLPGGPHLTSIGNAVDPK